ncbi:hypothetical protein BD770DRAFT_394437 [Pilaira anomala]|nr:hypothetical protein BD770DRAFT_394437 [Pilaira anomala]
MPPIFIELLLEASCKLWAKKCVLLAANTVSNHLNQGTLDPTVLALFKAAKYFRFLRP